KLGPLVSGIEDGQQFMTPLIFRIMNALFMAMFGLSAPQSTLITTRSYIPLLTPMLMLMLVCRLALPIREIAISLRFLIRTISLLALLGARVYKGGVFMSGQSSSIRDFKKAIALSKKD